MKPLCAFLALTFLFSSGARAGAYQYSSQAGDPDLGFDQPGRINHMYGYSGVATALTIAVCADPSAAEFVPHIQAAIDYWNSKTTAVPNCNGFCAVHLDPLPRSTGPVDAHYVLVHELGHCLFGLDHTNNFSPDGSLTASDFTGAYKETDFTDDGADDIRGTYDDKPTPWPGTRIVHWFRTGIDDPYLAVPATIDNTNYTRVIQNLPAGHFWPTNANRLSSFQLGYENSQSVMFSLGARRSTYSGLLPDDVNTVAYAQAGLDEVVGGDDYTYTVTFVEDCQGADVKVEMSNTMGSDLGRCTVSYLPLPIPGETLQHLALTSSPEPSLLQLNSTLVPGWTFQFILWDDFEIGDTSYWTETVPPLTRRFRGPNPESRSHSGGN